MKKHEITKKASDMPTQEEMDYYNSRYFVINKNMMTFLGVWPYQGMLGKILIRIVISLIIITSMVPQIICAVIMKHDVERMIPAVATLIYFFGIGAKFIGMIVTESKLKFLYKSIVRNWSMLENQTERGILQHSSEVGRLLTIGYVGYMVQAAIIFVMLPIAHHTYDVIWPLTNESRIIMFILDGEYLLDKKDYYYYIFLFEVFTVAATVPMIFTIDSTYAVCIQQCVGLLNVVKLRLELATKPSKKLYSTNDKAYEAISKSAELHEKVLNFGNVLESSYSSSLLVVMIVNVIVLAAGAVNILFNLNNSVLFLRYMFLNMGFAIHMFYLSWPGQKMIDASNSIFYAAYNNEWYDCSIESQKLLKFIMQRTAEPFYLTSGGFYIMNFENFVVLLKSSLSYITVLASFNS